MKPTPAKTILALGLLAAWLLPVAAAEPNADQLLRGMSAKLAAAHTFSFEATREIDPALLAGRNVAENAHLVVTVQRPDKFAAVSTSKDSVRHFYADGRNLSLADGKMNLYATVPMHTSIDGLVADIDRIYGFTPPLAEIALSDVYQDIRRKAESVSYLGQGSYAGGFLGLGGVACHRLVLTGKFVDAELWLGVGDQLPRRLIVTVKNHPGKPALKVDFSDWNLAARVTEQDFVFVPPRGARKIPMITTAKTTASQESLQGDFAQGSPVLFATTPLLRSEDEDSAFGWVAAGGARGFAVAGRGYGYGYGYGGARYGAVAVGYRGGLPAGYYGAIPGAYRPVLYGGYNCYYAGGVYYRPAFYQGNTVYIVVR
jgi:hypothetical protein